MANELATSFKETLFDIKDDIFENDGLNKDYKTFVNELSQKSKIDETQLLSFYSSLGEIKKAIDKNGLDEARAMKDWMAEEINFLMLFMGERKEFKIKHQEACDVIAEVLGKTPAGINSKFYDVKKELKANGTVTEKKRGRRAAEDKAAPQMKLVELNNEGKAKEKVEVETQGKTVKAKNVTKNKKEESTGSFPDALYGIKEEIYEKNASHDPMTFINDLSQKTGVDEQTLFLCYNNVAAVKSLIDKDGEQKDWSRPEIELMMLIMEERKKYNLNHTDACEVIGGMLGKPKSGVNSKFYAVKDELKTTGQIIEKKRGRKANFKVIEGKNAKDLVHEEVKNSVETTQTPIQETVQVQEQKPERTPMVEEKVMNNNEEKEETISLDSSVPVPSKEETKIQPEQNTEIKSNKTSRADKILAKYEDKNEEVQQESVLNSPIQPIRLDEIQTGEKSITELLSGIGNNFKILAQQAELTDENTHMYRLIQGMYALSSIAAVNAHNAGQYRNIEKELNQFKKENEFLRSENETLKEDMQVVSKEYLEMKKEVQKFNQLSEFDKLTDLPNHMQRLEYKINRVGIVEAVPSKVSNS